MKIQLPIIYSQWDIRWGNTLLGFNTVATYNMYNFGCFVTAWAMVCRYYGKDVDPGTLNQKLIELGAGKGFTAGGGDYVPGGVNRIYSTITETRTLTPSALTDAQIGQIKTQLDNGYPVIVCLDYNPRTVAAETHFVVLVDYNPDDENDFTIADPLGGKIQSLKTYLGWYKLSVRNTIESYVCTTGPKPKYNLDTIPVLKTDFEQLVHNSTEWDKIVAYLRPGADPKVTRFEDLQTIVAGIKSTQTDLTNKLNQAVSERDLALVEIQNQKDKLTNVSSQYERALQTKDAEITALKATIPNIDNLEGTYKATIKELEGKLREAQKNVGLRDLDVTRLQNELADCKKGVCTWSKFIEALQNIFKK